MIVTEGGAGYGVTYKPELLMVPTPPAQPDGPAAAHVTSGLNAPVPLTVAVNCSVSPMVTVGADGVTVTPVMAGPAGCVGALPPLLPHPSASAATSVLPGAMRSHRFVGMAAASRPMLLVPCIRLRPCHLPYCGITNSVIDCAGKVYVSVLVVLGATAGVTVMPDVTVAIEVRLALLY